MPPPRDQNSIDNRHIANSRENPTLLAVGAGILALIAILLAVFAMAEERRQETTVDRVAQKVGDAARQVDRAAQSVADGLKR